MKLFAAAAAALLAISLSGCASGADTKAAPAVTVAAKDVRAVSLESAMTTLDKAGVDYEVRVQGPEATILADPKSPSEKGKWKVLVLKDDTTPGAWSKETLKEGDFVQIIVNPLVDTPSTPTPTPTPTPQTATLTYVVEADGPIESVTFATDLGGKNTEEKVTAPGTRFTKEITLTPYQVNGRHTFTVHAWPGAGTTTISCKILVDGVARDSGSLTNSSSFVQCIDLEL